ncbi:MAG: sugar ABC transporter permease [Opitutales bacterium]|nr:sugar ABC transporter permease [Opitutales bacterium]
MSFFSNRSVQVAPYLFLAPFASVFLVFMVYPLFQSVILAMEQTFGPEHTQFVGFANLRYVFGDPFFYTALRNTFIFAAASVLLQMPLSLALAMLLNQPWLKGRWLLRLIFFSPALVGAVFVGVMFSIIFERRTGLLNVVLHRLFGFSLDFPWLQEYAMPAMIIASLWMWTGFNMLYFLAALQNVDKELMEAAHMDGAGPWDRFLNVTLPAIRPIGGFVVLLSLIGAFQVFELPFLLFDGPGVDNRGLTIVMYLYQSGFQLGDLGYASTIGWILAIILIALSWLQRRLSRNESYS